MKKFASLLLAGALCMGLAVPALAAEETNTVTLNYDGPSQIHEETVECLKGSPYNDFYSTNTFNGWRIVKPGTVFTATNEGTEDNGSYGHVNIREYTRQPAGTTIWMEDYDEEIEDFFGYEVDVSGKYLNHGDRYLVTDYFSYGSEEAPPSAGAGLYWDWEINGAWDNALKLYPGESVQFTVPASQEDVIYQIYVETYYPESDWRYWNWTNFKMGDVVAVETPVAYASTQNVLVDGKSVEFQCYALKDENGNDTNYIKLRDVAAILNGTAAQFEVGWTGAVNIETGKAYTPNGSEMSTPYSGDRAYEEATAPTNVNGAAADLSAIVLKDDAGNG